MFLYYEFNNNDNNNNTHRSFPLATNRMHLATLLCYMITYNQQLTLACCQQLTSMKKEKQPYEDSVDAIVILSL